jgi:hypothetical protein
VNIAHVGQLKIIEAFFKHAAHDQRTHGRRYTRSDGGEFIIVSGKDPVSQIAIKEREGGGSSLRLQMIIEAICVIVG